MFYQNIRQEALRKIDFMSYNQKYYDDLEVRRLHSVVENCNMLIHKKKERKGWRGKENVDRSSGRGVEKTCRRRNHPINNTNTNTKRYSEGIDLDNPTERLKLIENNRCSEQK